MLSCCASFGFKLKEHAESPPDDAGLSKIAKIMLAFEFPPSIWDIFLLAWGGAARLPLQNRTMRIQRQLYTSLHGGITTF